MDSRKLYAFDLDGTILTCNTSFFFYKYGLLRGFFPVMTLFLCIISFFKYKSFYYTPTQLHKALFEKLFKGKSFQELESLSERCVEQIENYFFPPTIKFLEKAKSSGDYILILSSSPYFLIKRIVKKFSPDFVIGTKYSYDQKGIIKDIAYLVDGEEKARIIKNLTSSLGISYSIGFSDSYFDLPFLKSVTRPIVVNPDKKLKNIAKNQNWSRL